PARKIPRSRATSASTRRRASRRPSRGRRPVTGGTARSPTSGNRCSPIRHDLTKEPHAMNELKTWMNGTIVPPAEAVLPVDRDAVFYGTNVFEGLRAYWNEAAEQLYCI